MNIRSIKSELKSSQLWIAQSKSSFYANDGVEAREIEITIKKTDHELEIELRVGALEWTDYVHTYYVHWSL